jgi:hypothetical protein
VADCSVFASGRRSKIEVSRGFLSGYAKLLPTLLDESCCP